MGYGLRLKKGKTRGFSRGNSGQTRNPRSARARPSSKKQRHKLYLGRTSKKEGNKVGPKGLMSKNLKKTKWGILTANNPNPRANGGEKSFRRVRKNSNASKKKKKKKRSDTASVFHFVVGFDTEMVLHRMGMFSNPDQKKKKAK